MQLNKRILNVDNIRPIHLLHNYIFGLPLHSNCAAFIVICSESFQGVCQKQPAGDKIKRFTQILNSQIMFNLFGVNMVQVIESFPTVQECTTLVVVIQFPYSTCLKHCMGCSYYHEVHDHYCVGKGPYADHILIPQGQGSTGNSTFF